MGDVLKQDMAISIGVMLKLQELFERDYWQSSGEERQKIVEGATFALIAYCILLRGFEVPKIDLAALRENRVQIDSHGKLGVIAHVGVPLVVRFKSEKGEQCHIIPMAAETRSGLRPLEWVKRLVQEREDQGLVKGWAFLGHKGEQAPMKYFAETILDRLVRIQEIHTDLINPGINAFEEFGLAQSFWRGSNLQAQNRQVPADIIN